MSSKTECPTIIEQCRAAMPGLTWTEVDGNIIGCKGNPHTPDDCPVHLTIVEDGEGEDYTQAVQHRCYGVVVGEEWHDLYDYASTGRDVDSYVRGYHADEAAMHMECVRALGEAM